MKIEFKLNMNTSQVIHRLDTRFQKAQRFLDSEVLRCSEPYVPMRTGNLARSGQNGTNIGSGQIIYNAPYAKYQYYGLNHRFNKDLHPQACAQWFEKAKAAHKSEWIGGVERIIKE